ncbi:hypothetical protein [Neobacillus drentensis]|uniref:hypothetical protein n=1 Tax=Neobacillus drentensis TaxID=220684 RepID=UPI002FFD9082
MQITKRQSLRLIENQLENQINKVEVVSELELDRKHFDNLIHILKAFQPTLSDDKRIAALWLNYPNVCLTVTVFVAVYEYDNNLWDRFISVTGIEETKIWKEKLWAYMKSNKIKVFHEKERLKYFNTVLGHAGIPYHSVPKLIENVIIPANARGLNEINIYENVKREKYTSLVHKGVKSFIELGDRVSFSMIHRIQSVWRNYDKPFAKKYAGYLPNHILQAMDDYKPQPEEGSFYYRRPYIYYDHEERMIHLNLPSVRVRGRRVEGMYWLINDQKSSNQRKVNMENLIYEAGDYEEYSPEFQSFPLEPNHNYQVELYLEEMSAPIYKDILQIKDLLIQFNDNQKLVGLEDAYLEKEYGSVVFILKKKEAVKVIDAINYATVFQVPLKGIWKYYSAVFIQATRKENFRLNTYIFRLNRKTTEPYLKGEKQDHLIHLERPVFKVMPSIFLPKKVIKEINDGQITQIRLLNEETLTSRTKQITAVDVVKQKNEGYLRIDDLMSDQDDFIESYNVSLSGKLGYDYHFSFVVMRESMILLEQEQQVTIQLPASYSLSIQWPLNIESSRSEDIYKITIPENQFKMKVSVINNSKGAQFEFILYTALYNIRFIGNDDVYYLGSEISRNKWYNKHFEMEIDTMNPTFEKEIGSLCKLEIIGGQNTIFLDVHSSFVSYYPTNEIFERDSKSEILYEYRFTTADYGYEPLIHVRNMWLLKTLQSTLNDLELSLSWDQSNYLNEKFIRIWNLNKPLEKWIDIPLSKGTHNFHYLFTEPGIYMLEWKDHSSEEVDRPLFESGKHQIFNVATSESLAYMLLLYEDRVNDEEYTLEKIIDLLQIIDYFGDKYLSLILKNYEDCCDFGIIAGNHLVELHSTMKIKKRHVDILTEITGVQELGMNTMLPIYKKLLNKNFKDNFLKLKDGYFSQSKLIQTHQNLTIRQLNIKMQEINPFTTLLSDFSLQKEMVRYLYKIKNDEEYRSYIKKVLNDYKKTLSDFYKRLKQHPKNIRFGVFEEIDQRDYKRKFKLEQRFLDYPYFIAQLALANRAFLSAGENVFGGEDGIKQIREITQKVLQYDKNWFLHDLFFITLLIEEKNREYEERMIRIFS